MNYLKPPSNLIRGQLSKYDFLNEQKKGHGLKIYPFSEHCQKAASYDITPTIIAMSAKTGMLETVYREKCHLDDKYYIYVHAKDTVLIVSNEYILVPPTMAGYVSSRVSKVVEGFGHISTTIDPNWSGAALIAISNPSNQMLKIYVGKNALPSGIPNNLATITFHYLHTPCKLGDKEKRHRGMRIDLLKQVAYTQKRGLRSFFRKCFCFRRREFTDYFFARSKMLESEFTEEVWDEFLNDFSSLKASSSSKLENKSQKAKKTARDFIITEHIFIRFYHFIVRFKSQTTLLLLILLFVLWQLSILPENSLNILLQFFTSI